MEITSIHEARKILPTLIKRALAGEEIILSEKGTPLVRLTPLEHGRKKNVNLVGVGKVKSKSHMILTRKMKK
jgi:prevent-host-death family protein